MSFALSIFHHGVTSGKKTSVYKLFLILRNLLKCPTRNARRPRRYRIFYHTRNSKNALALLIHRVDQLAFSRCQLITAFLMLWMDGKII
jgi:hypothetical protein